MNPLGEMLFCWVARFRAVALSWRFCIRRDASSLQAYLAHLVRHDMPLDLAKDVLRRKLFQLPEWQTKGSAGEFLFASVCAYLADHTRPEHRNYWQAWIRHCRLGGRKIDVTGPQMAVALRKAYESGVLEGLPAEDRQFLLGLYRDAYANVLGHAGEPTAPEMLSVLLSYASVLHEVGSDDTARRFLQRLNTHFQARPRDLRALSEEDSLAFPECGVGSPHRIGVTIYHESGSWGPVRVTGAGMTADPTLRAQVFTNLFSAALACNDEPTLVTAGGWSLTMTHEGPAQSVGGGKVLCAVLTPAGAGEPTHDTPTLGMTPQEALSIISDSFERLQEATGLVRVMRWERRDADKLEERVRTLLAECRNGIRVLRSESRHSEGASVIHVMPLLYRHSRNGVVPVEIDVPYEALGPKTVFDLLRKGRNTYMRQLISAARGREAYARRAWEEQGEAIQAWKRRSEDEKGAICERRPTVTITMQYDWDLGISVRLDPPEEMPRRKYEEELRPQLWETAKQKETEFAEIAVKLEKMNRPGGRADILTFKVLVDSMIRRAAIDIHDEAFQAEYAKWVDTCSGPLWAAVEVWARAHGLAPESLAADNICFNVHVQPKSGKVRLQPMALIDLHDFLVRIDGDRGVMEVFPGGRTKALGDCFVPDKALRILNPTDLHARLVEWMKEHCPVGAIAQNGQKELDSAIMSDSTVNARIRLAQAKRALFRGKPDDALAIIGGIRRADLTAVYLWGAVAQQYSHLCDVSLRGLPAEGKERNERLLNLAISILIEVLKAEEPLPPAGRRAAAQRGAAGAATEEQVRARREQALALASPQAKDYLGQLRSCDPEAVADLTAENPDIAALERKSFALSEEMDSRFYAAVQALSALELLALAETTNDVARALPFEGRMTDKLREDIHGLIERKESLSLASPPSCLELDELVKSV